MRTPEIDIPASPTTHELHITHPMSMAGEFNVITQRNSIDSAAREHETNLIALVGNCARPNISELGTILTEGVLLQQLRIGRPSLAVSHRGPVHKPRTNPELDWQGEEQTDPAGTFKSMHAEASALGHVSIEVRTREHLVRYGHLLSALWTGGRNETDHTLIHEVATFDPHIFVMVKNGLHGEIDTALSQVETIKEKRSEAAGASAAMLLFRGGENAQSPVAWREQYLRALDRTDGKMIVDVAHGSEMAHDPSGNFKKSVAGQLLAMEAVIDCAREGFKPAGIMIEASDLPSKTDPHMPFELALEGVKALHATK